MAKVVGDIAVTVGADTSAFEKAMKRSGKATEGFNARFVQMSKDIATASTAIAGSMAVMANAAVSTGAEIEKLSRLADATPERFQKMAKAAQTAGISQEKLADQLKDVNDKLGDFAATGGGPLKDFFEKVAPKVGITAENFKNLAAPDALQLFVNTLERAGTPQQEMVFHLEAMASDLTALLPLLQNNGAEMARLGERASEAGTILSDEAVKGAADLEAQMRLLGDSMRTQVNAAFLENKDQIEAIVGVINGALIPAMSKLIEFLGLVAEGYNKWGEAYTNIRNRLGLGYDTPIDVPTENPLGSGVSGGTISDFRNGGGGRIQGLLGGAGILPGGGGGGGGGGIAGSEGNDQLTDFLQQRFDIISDFAGREVELTTNTANAIMDVEAMAGQSRLAHMRTIFGGFASLMQTENDKLFKIGKAAALAQAIVDGHAAAVSAWNAGMRVGPGLAAAYTAASLARTGALISSIASASPRGTSVGGATGGGGFPAGGAQTVNRTIDVRLIGGDSVTQTNMRSLVNELGEYLRDGGSISGLRLA